ILHTPVKDDCTNCHTQVGDHKFSMKNKERNCLSCHTDKKEGSNVHAAMISNDCQKCHDPHGGNSRSLLKKSREDELCFECHDTNPMSGKFVHGPQATGRCTICHNPHSSSHSALLKSSKETACTECHTDKDYSGENFNIHTPLKDGCLGCHDAHSSDYPYQLLKSAKDVCLLCHSDLDLKASRATFKHAILKQEDGCANCHDPHGSVYEHNLKESPLHLCLNCHNKPIIGTDGKDYNIYKIVTTNPRKHGPISDGNCSGCHNPHGSEFYKMLTGNFPEQFYTEFQESKYDLCFQCHDSTLVRDQRTTTLTNFRDGDLNLHYLHITRKKGRTCRACHEVHAGELNLHIRRETPFGSWDIPIEFEKEQDGGRCSPGCHKAYSYKR
ncbi:MAG: hypothetical protein MUP70_14360, partial [Candidatus Aminicenantes bacterium]|nr:hypothetical protein [Candidatus Aminicenantes bacterium]